MGRLDGIISAIFNCKVCGAETETIKFMQRGAPGNYCTGDAINYDFGSETMVLSEGESDKIKRAIEKSDAAALYEAHHRFLPTYCPECDACYCKKHWKIEDHPDPNSDYYSMHFNTYGTCPSKHKRLMAKDSYNWSEDE